MGNLTLREAGLKIGKSEKTLRRWIQKGKLNASKNGRFWAVTDAALEQVTSHVSKDWKVGSEITELRMKVEAHDHAIEDLHKQVKKLSPKKSAKKSVTR